MNDIYSENKFLWKYVPDFEYPKHLQIDLTTRCVHKCVFCEFSQKSGYRTNIKKNQSDIKFDRLINLLDSFGDQPAITLIGGGEPLIYYKRKQVLQELIKRNYKFGIVTNLGMNINNIIDELSFTQWVRVSLDSGSNSTYKEVHNPLNDKQGYDYVLDNIWKLVQRGVYVGVSYLVCDPNCDVKEIINVCNTVKRLGVKYIAFKPLWNDEGNPGDKVQENLIGIEKTIEWMSEELTDKNFQIIDNFTNRNQNYLRPQRKWTGSCKYQNLNVQIGADGEVYPCCVLKYSKQFSYGNINDLTIEEIWKGEQRKKVVDNLTPDRCPPCNVDSVNKKIELLDKYIRKDLPEFNLHTDFI